MTDSSNRPEGVPGGAGLSAGSMNGPNEDRERARAAFERKHDPARVLALSDGVFAIIITLLVLDIHVPTLVGGQSLTTALDEIWPTLTAFVISFIVAGMYWVGHRDLFTLIRRTDRQLVWLNIVFLLPLCLLPFGASLVGHYEVKAVALRIYGAVLVAIAVMRVVNWMYAASRPALLWRPLSRNQRLAGIALGVLPGLLYLLAILLAGITPVISLAIYAAGPLLYFLGITGLRATRKRNQEYADFT